MNSFRCRCKVMPCEIVTSVRGGKLRVDHAAPIAWVRGTFLDSIRRQGSESYSIEGDRLIVHASNGIWVWTIDPGYEEIVAPHQPRRKVGELYTLRLAAAEPDPLLDGDPVTNEEVESSREVWEVWSR